MSEELQQQISLEPERYELAAAAPYRFDLDRRDFFRFLGAGILVASVLKPAVIAQESGGARQRRGDSLPQEIDAWLHVGENGKVTVCTGKAEMGQNIRTSLSQGVAEELRVPMGNIDLVMGDTQFTPFDMGTFGSRTTPTMAPQLRRVASAARDLLLQTAAKEWNTAPEKLVAANAKITDPVSGRSATYAELARGKTLAQSLPDEDPMTPASEWTTAGKSLPKVDGRAFVTGRHQYTSDLRPAGLLHGKVLRPPSFAATMTSCDVTAAQKLPFAVIVHDGDFVAAAAPSESEAEEAVAAIRAQWKETPQP
ncbi:MAG TPA: molybdopterin cofactor-binding domain-containing protein, partial [Candidatus Binatus sp.]|nr:molybdopterin cofactor-binding domain-containing protein [Candidatus Binatus sp.]